MGNLEVKEILWLAFSVLALPLALWTLWDAVVDRLAARKKGLRNGRVVAANLFVRVSFARVVTMGTLALIASASIQSPREWEGLAGIQDGGLIVSAVLFVCTVADFADRRRLTSVTHKLRDQATSGVR